VYVTLETEMHIYTKFKTFTLTSDSISHKTVIKFKINVEVLWAALSL